MFSDNPNNYQKKLKNKIYKILNLYLLASQISLVLPQIKFYYEKIISNRVRWWSDHGELCKERIC